MEKFEQSERLSALNCLKESIMILQAEILEEPGFERDGVRLMREGLGVFLNNFGAGQLECIWLDPKLRLRSSNVSLERVEGNRIIPVEDHPGGLVLWKNKVVVILNCLETRLST